MPITPIRINFGRGEAWGLFMVEQVERSARRAENSWGHYTHYALNFVIQGDGHLIDPHGNPLAKLEPGVAYQHRPGDAAAGWRVKWHSPQTEEIYCIIDERSFKRMEALQFFPSTRAFPQQDPSEFISFLRQRFEAFNRSAASLPCEVNRQAIAQCTALMADLFDKLERIDPMHMSDATLTNLSRRLAIDPASRTPLPEIAQELGVSYASLRRKFCEAYGITLRHYRIQLRIEAARGLLTQFNVKETAVKLGYPDAFTFSTQYKRITGQSPQDARKRQSARVQITGKTTK